MTFRVFVFHRLLGLEEEAFWLEVAVAHSGFVHVGHGADHLLHDDRSLDLREAARLDNLVKELVSNTKLHDKVDVLLILEVVVVELDDVRVVHELHLAVLRLNALAVELVMLR